MLADDLRAALSVEALGALRKRVVDAADQGNDPAVSLKARIPCPLLDNHRCSAYERRPITCRAHTSTSRLLCEEMKDHPERTVQTGFDA
jgi:Fe-S-cluster containining protein